MKYILILSFALLISLSFAVNTNLKRHKDVVIDRSTSGVQLSQVVRRNPTISSSHQYGLPTASAGSNSISFGSNNDDNGSNIGGYGKTAAIASILIDYFRSIYLFPQRRRNISNQGNPSSCWI